MGKEKKVKGYIHYCEECNHDWITKKEEYVCPECKSVYLAVEKLY